MRLSGCSGESDHPRSRGVYRLGTPKRPVLGGSSPLARGLRFPSAGSAQSGWIIPARAGFTNTRPHSYFAVTDHPRSRGVYWAMSADRPTRRGSSPLARGLPRPRRQRRPRRPDHPRSRGVYDPLTGDVLGRGGSSPLARGLLTTDYRKGLIIGIIPARAGFTFRPGSRPGRDGDHPRSRGVYGWPAGRPGEFRGSSPLARGLLHETIKFGRRARIIPARAGFTRRPEGQADHPRDHPRSRGVYVDAAFAVISREGSSPLARGLHPLD